jgi:hypothetical protein
MLKLSVRVFVGKQALGEKEFSSAAARWPRWRGGHRGDHRR